MEKWALLSVPGLQPASFLPLCLSGPGTLQIAGFAHPRGGRSPRCILPPRSFLHRGGRAHAAFSGPRSRTPSPAPCDSPPAPALLGRPSPPPRTSLTLPSLHPGLRGSGVPGRLCGGGAELVWEAKAEKENPRGWGEASRVRGSQGSRRGARQRVCAARCPGRGGLVRWLRLLGAARQPLQ